MVVIFFGNYRNRVVDYVIKGVCGVFWLEDVCVGRVVMVMVVGQKVVDGGDIQG